MDKHGRGLAEKEGGAGFRGLDRDDLLTLYREQQRLAIARQSREDLEKELLQFYMTQAYQFTVHKLRWILAVGKVKIKNVLGLKSALDD